MNPELSVILVTRTDLEVLRTTLKHLRAQTVADRLEIIVVASHPLPAEAGIRQVVGEIRTLAGAQVLGLRAAQAPVVALGEDHSFPAPDWAEKLLAAHREGHAAVAPLVLNANPRTLKSWANYMMGFGRFGNAAAAGLTNWLPWHNTSYKRDVLLKTGDRLPLYIAVEGLLHDELRAQGHTLYLHPGTHTRHINYSLFRPWLVQAMLGGRLFSAARAQRYEWPVWKRLVYALASPLFLLAWLYRVVQIMAANPQQRRLLPWLIPLLAIGMSAHVWGQLLGNLCGVGQAEEHYLDYETARLRHIIPADYQELIGA